MPEYLDTPAEVSEHLRGICAQLPDAYEEPSWAGIRWRIRKKTFVAVWTRQHERGPVTGLQFRSPDPEFGVLVAGGYPFARAGWGTNVVNMHIDERTDWEEVAELMMESYCVMAPKRLAALIPRGDVGEHR
jgi:hypothetical protein